MLLPSPGNIVGMPNVIASTIAFDGINKENSGTRRRQVVFDLLSPDIAPRREQGH